MKRSAVAAILFASMWALGLNAQSLGLRANIPFDFNVGSTLMPAGEYDINHVNGVLRLRNSGSQGKAIMILARTEQRAAAEKPATLVFNRYGSTYFLAKVWDAYSNTGRVLGPSKHEKELIARGATVQTAGVTANAR